MTTPLSEGAIMMHEFFVSLVENGFTEAQALTIISNMMRPAPTADGEEQP